MGGAYTEGHEDHQTVGVFHSFSTLPNLNWCEELLRACNINFEAPLRRATWLYQLQDGRNHNANGIADVALRVVDDSNPKSELAVVFEAKRKGGALKPKDLSDPERYCRLSQLSPCTRRLIVFLVDDK